jgi:hypothetical protein
MPRARVTAARLAQVVRDPAGLAMRDDERTEVTRHSNL